MTAGASCFVAVAQAQAATDWADLEGRIQYAYYTNDSRALNGVLASLKPRPGAEAEDASAGDAGTRSYFRALAHYRLAQVLNATKRGNPRSAIGDCGDEDEVEEELHPGDAAVVVLGGGPAAGRGDEGGEIHSAGGNPGGGQEYSAAGYYSCRASLDGLWQENETPRAGCAGRFERG